MICFIGRRFYETPPDIDDLIFGDAGTVPSERLCTL
jgi:hypothetical protein